MTYVLTFGSGSVSPPLIARLQSTPGLRGLKNGELLDAAESAGFDVLITIDRGFPYEQNLSGRTISIVLLRPRFNPLADILPFASACLGHLRNMMPGEIRKIDSP